MGAEVRIEGLKELNRSLDRVNRKLKKTISDALKDAAEPVRDSAERFATQKIRNIGSVWPRMRVGTTTGTVYVSPAARRRGGSPRPNLGVLLFEQAMTPALDKHADDLKDAVGKAIDNITRQEGF